MNDKLSALNETVEQRVEALNSSTLTASDALSSNMTAMFAQVQRLVLDLAREVFSPLEVDRQHPDYLQYHHPPPPPTGDKDDEADRFQRIDRLKRARNKQAASPPPPPPKTHYLHEELRVEVRDSWWFEAWTGFMETANLLVLVLLHKPVYASDVHLSS